MDIKISEKTVTFKITEEELNILLNGQPLKKNVLIAANDFVMAIDLADESADVPLRLILDRDGSCLILRTSIEQIRKLVEMGKSREGLFCNWSELDISLQVDVRANSHPRRKD